MKKISKRTRQKVQQRAGYRCEYCLSHQNFVMSKLQVDHIRPIAAKGTNSLDNLCVACEFCNQFKWAKTHGIDPETGERVPLFNPRKQKWTEHFTWSTDGSVAIGLSSVGRATIAALEMNNQLAVTVRKNWVKAGWHPPSTDI